MGLTMDFRDGLILKKPYLWMGGPLDIGQRSVIHDYKRDLLVTKVRCKDLPDSDQGDFRCQRAVVCLFFLCDDFIYI